MAGQSSSTPSAQFFGILLDHSQQQPLLEDEMNPDPESLIFNDINEASKFLKQNKGARMKSFRSREQALEFVNRPQNFLNDSICSDLSASFERISISTKPASSSSSSPAGGGSGEETTEKLFSSPAPAQLTVLRRAIESGDYEKVESVIWNNPRFLVTVCDSAVYLMAGPKYNACHIAARANKPEILALIMETVSNHSFMKKLYPQESNQNILDRVKHLVDSYLNTPDPRQGNTPLQFACKLGFHKVVKVLLTFEACDLNHRDSNGKTAEENICCQVAGGGHSGGGEGDGDGEAATSTYKKIKNMFKKPLNSPYQKDQLKKRLLMDKRLNKSDSALIL